MDTDYLSMDEIRSVEGQPVYDLDGDKIGTVEEIFYDEATNRPEWIGIGTGFFKTKRVLVPVERAALATDGYRVPYTKDMVKDSPDVDSDEISEDLERRLYDYYGLHATYASRDRDLAEPRDEATVTRSEEELAVGKREVEAGRVRLRKWVETEPVAVDVALEREEARVRREPIDAPAGAADIGAEEVEVRLSREEPVVEKRAVAKERVSVDKDVEVDTETVTDELRKERVEIEGDEADRRR